MKRIILFAAALTCVAATKAQTTTDTLKQQQLDEVVVSGVRIQKNAPYAVANIKKDELESFSKSGRELPFLLARTPGVLAWGENGLGTGTAAMRIRGAAGSRINITLDGVALNSPEDQTVFWANMNSYASLMGSVQIQRGIGTSTNGDGAFGGSVSMATSTPGRKPSVEVSGSYGSYNTYNAGVKFSTGLLSNHLVFDGAYHETATDGYVHGTAGRSGSYYGGLTWLDDNFRISYKNIGNFEKTGQAWNGVVTGSNDLSLMDGTYGVRTGITTYKDLYDRGLGKFNQLYEYLQTDAGGAFVKDADGNYQTERYTMRDGSFWNKTTDNFYQNHNLLSFAFHPSAHWSHHVTLHYTYGYGYYSEFKHNTKFAKFGLTFTDSNGKFVKKSDFVRRKGLSQHTYGLVYTSNYKDGNWDVMGGLNLQQFRGSHFGYLTYIKNEEADAKYRAGGKDYKYYDSDAHKYDYSGFFKAKYNFADYWNVFMDLQIRHVEYMTDGQNDRFYKVGSGYQNQLLDISERYDFVNPKAGISYYRGGH
ncbi:MAG: TonB-dependent receptor plug domain-containing protein, partial [Prevotella denticola]